MEEVKKNENQELNEQTLRKVAGGSSDAEEKDIHDARGRVVGVGFRAGTVWRYVYWPCPKCGRPMHRGTLNFDYCDPCDYKQWDDNDKMWYDSEEELIAFANTAF